MNRTYRLLDLKSKRHGNTFALCDKHKPDYKIGKDTELKLVANKSMVGTKCFMCGGVEKSA